MLERLIDLYKEWDWLVEIPPLQAELIVRGRYILGLLAPKGQAGHLDRKRGFGRQTELPMRTPKLKNSQEVYETGQLIANVKAKLAEEKK